MASSEPPRSGRGSLCRDCFKICLGLQIAAVYKLEAEPSLDAKVAVGDLDIERRGYFHNNADIGILDISVNKSQSDESPRRAGRSRRFWLKHQSESGDAWLGTVKK
jgi:hypothetical protein